VSFVSAECLLENLPVDAYEAIPLFVGKDAVWHAPKESKAQLVRQLSRPPKDLLLDGLKPGSKPAGTRWVAERVAIEG